MIIWPETMVQGYLQPELWPQLAGADLAEDMAFHEALGRHAKGTAYVLVGAYGGEVMRDPLGKDYLGKYNSAYLYRPDGTRDPGRYDKIHLVLFGEYIPFRRHIPWLFEQLKRFLPEGYNPDYSLEHGKRYTIFEMNDSTKGQRTDDIGQRPAGGLARSGPVRASGGPAAPGWESNTAEGGGATSGVTTNALDAATPTDPQSAIRNHVTPDLDPGPQSPQAPPYRFAVIICYEDTIPYVARNFTLDKQGRKRIDWLVNISNDGWFVRFVKDPPEVIPSTELPQHAAICVFRAVENRLAVVRSVNTGISCLIESTGRIRDGYMAAGDGFPAGVMERTAMAGWFLDRLPIDKRVTFYSRHGEWLANGCAAVFVATLAWPLGGRFVRRRTREQTKANG
ncbi:MAG: hypothetical protein A2Y77_10145 [Planctomycetes bacterium RBG_13_62_9]|nr:MAG: hypothetical protein A2Y77_10145 [Planctomycetes bacterium RBG_13_62_9]